MATHQLMPTDALLQECAPVLYQLLQTRPSRFHHTISVGDVTGTYGVSIIHQVRVELWRAKCVLCGETEDSRQVAVCYGHRFEKGWRAIADTESADLIIALTTANAKVRAFYIVAGIPYEAQETSQKQYANRQVA